MALLRVKRRPQEDAIDALLLACKKQKTEDSMFSTVFKFAATVEEKDKDKDFQTHVNNVRDTQNSDAKNSVFKKRQVADITEKLRAENKLFSQNNRLKVINCFRHVESEGPESELTVIDIEKHSDTEKNEASKDNKDSDGEPLSTDEQYVYDLYYSHEGGFDEIQMENMLSAHAVDELLFDFSPQDNEEEQVFVDDEDDSNDENNWRNDYPEEISDDSSLEESDIRLAMQMKNVNIDGEYESDLSSDREDDALLYDKSDLYHREAYYCDSDQSLSDYD